MLSEALDLSPHFDIFHESKVLDHINRSTGARRTSSEV